MVGTTKAIIVLEGICLVFALSPPKPLNDCLGFGLFTTAPQIPQFLCSNTSSPVGQRRLPSLCLARRLMLGYPKRSNRLLDIIYVQQRPAFPSKSLKTLPTL